MGELTVDVKHDIVDLSYRVASGLIAAVTPETRDPEATAVVILGALVALRRTAWTFGFSPLDLDDDRALTAWVDVALAILDVAPVGEEQWRSPELQPAFSARRRCRTRHRH